MLRGSRNTDVTEQRFQQLSACIPTQAAKAGVDSHQFTQEPVIKARTEQRHHQSSSGFPHALRESFIEPGNHIQEPEYIDTSDGSDHETIPEAQRPANTNPGIASPASKGKRPTRVTNSELGYFMKVHPAMSSMSPKSPQFASKTKHYLPAIIHRLGTHGKCGIL
ncbi:hypothetical protein DPMN_110507 [Dreissena polymorpha]|uniref:Uncharacterized protein n=1 Tax=Dreissena polymorpha TaxID=45954 RepID=A0A9D4KCS9_DREPO|nr:hypothetical protein DPMN_110507 [Dreissena polymorpha]